MKPGVNQKSCYMLSCILLNSFPLRNQVSQNKSNIRPYAVLIMLFGVFGEIRGPLHSMSLSQLVLKRSGALCAGERAVSGEEQLNFKEYIFKWEDRNQISDNQHIWKKFASLRELQKQWGTESNTKAEAVAAVTGQLGEWGEAGKHGRKGHAARAGWEHFTGLAGTQTAFLLPCFLRKTRL